MSGTPLLCVSCGVVIGVWDFYEGFCGVVVGVWDFCEGFCGVVVGVWDFYAVCFLWCIGWCLGLL